MVRNGWGTASKAAEKVPNADAAKCARPVARQIGFAGYQGTPSPQPPLAESMTYELIQGKVAQTKELQVRDSK